MAELQWGVEVRCVNTLLAAIKVDQRGQHVYLHVPDRKLDPHEFGVLIDGAEAAQRIADERRGAPMKPAASPAPLDVELGTVTEIERRNDLYDIRILKSGEVVAINASALLGPSELAQFIAEMKAVQGRLTTFE